MLLLVSFALLLFATVAVIIYRALRPRLRGVAGRPNRNYTPQQLPDTPFSDDPLLARFEERWQPGQLRPELALKIFRGGYASLTDQEEWEILLSTRTPSGALDGL